MMTSLFVPGDAVSVTTVAKFKYVFVHSIVLGLQRFFIKIKSKFLFLKFEL